MKVGTQIFDAIFQKIHNEGYKFIAISVDMAFEMVENVMLCHYECIKTQKQWVLYEFKASRTDFRNLDFHFCRRLTQEMTSIFNISNQGSNTISLLLCDDGIVETPSSSTKEEEVEEVYEQNNLLIMLFLKIYSIAL